MLFTATKNKQKPENQKQVFTITSGGFVTPVKHLRDHQFMTSVI